MIHRLTLSLVVSVALAACGTSGTSTGIQEVSCPPDSTLTYANFGQDVIQTNCLECHDGAERPNLSTQPKILLNTDKILYMAVYTDAMPAKSDMVLAERELVGEWLACGAP